MGEGLLEVRPLVAVLPSVPERAEVLVLVLILADVLQDVDDDVQPRRWPGWQWRKSAGCLSPPLAAPWRSRLPHCPSVVCFRFP